MDRHQITARVTADQMQMLRRLASRYGRSVSRETALAIDTHILEGAVALMAAGEPPFEGTPDFDPEFVGKIETALVEARERCWRRPLLHEVAERLAEAS